jgi:hypothetical protein
LAKNRKESRSKWDNPFTDILFEILFEIVWGLIRAAFRGVIRFIKHIGDFIPG